MNAQSSHPLYNRVWEKYREFDLTSCKLKKNWEFWQRVFLWMAIVGTLLAAVGSNTFSSGFFNHPKVLGCTGAIFLAAGTFLRKKFFPPSMEPLWTKARALAEILKSECFLFATGVPPYNGANAEYELKRRTDEQIGNAVSLFPGELEDDNGKEQPPAYPLNFDDYIKERINNQENYYTSATKRARTSFQHWQVVQIILGLLAVGLGSIAAFSTQDVGRVNALIVLTGAIIGITTAYATIGHSEYLCKSFGMLRNRMKDLAAEGLLCSEPVLFVQKCEKEMTAEHLSWIAEWRKKPDVDSDGSEINRKAA